MKRLKENLMEYNYIEVWLPFYNIYLWNLCVKKKKKVKVTICKFSCILLTKYFIISNCSNKKNMYFSNEYRHRYAKTFE